MMRESGDREASRSVRSWGTDDHPDNQPDSFKRDSHKDRDGQRSGRRERSREREREKERERDRDRDRDRERERERERDRSKTRTPDKDSREKNPKVRGREESKVKSGHHKPKIRWIHDDHLKKVKHYSIHDEPTADGLTEMKVREIRERQYREPSFSASTTVSRPSESSVKKTNGPSETIPWSKPKGVSRGEADKIIAGEKSIEKAQHASRIVGKIPCYYAREYQIPDEPRRDPINSTQGGLKQVLRLKIQPFKDFIEETPELKKQSSTLESQVGENPNAKLSYLTEQCRRQLNKRVGKPSIKKPREEQEEEDESEDSKYSGGGPDNETNWVPIAMFAGLLGLSFSDYRGYLGSLSRRCNKLDDAEIDRVKNNVDLIRNIFDLNSKVLSVNCNKAIEPNLGKRNSNGGLSKEQMAAQIKNVNRNWRTKHCNKYHSEAGCGRGEACHFIHDLEYKGVPVPENKNSAKPQSTVPSQQNGYSQRSSQGYTGPSNTGTGYTGPNYQGQMRLPMQNSHMNYGPPRPPMPNGYSNNGGMMPRQAIPNDFQPRPPGVPYPPISKP